MPESFSGTKLPNGLLAGPSDEVIGKPFPCISSDILQDGNSFFEQYLDVTGTGSRSIRLVRKDGEPIELRVSTWPIRSLDGAVIEIVSVYSNLTDRSRIEQDSDDQRTVAARQLAELTRLYETAPVGLCFLDTALRYVRINDHLAKINGRPAADHLGKRLRDIVPDIAGSVEPLYQHVLATGTPIHGQEIQAYPPGDPQTLHTWQVAYYPVRDFHGVIIGVQGVVQDVTSQKVSELAQAAAERRWRSLIENSSDGILLLDAACRIQYTGPRILGFGPEVRGTSALAMVHPDDLGSVEGLWRDLISKPGLSLAFEYRARHRDGTWKWVEVRGKNLLEDPDILAVVINYRDVTERRLMEDRLRHAEKMESLGVLAGGIAHDFNNLLTGILGNASLALDTLPADAIQRPLLSNAVKSCERAAHLTRQLLAYAGKGQFLIERINLGVLAQDLIELLRTAASRDVSIDLAVEENLPTLEADAVQMQQLLMNLIMNGTEAIGQNGKGKVRITVRSEVITGPLPAVSPIAGQIQSGLNVVLEVEDDGSGMDADTLGRIFDPFFTTKFTGRGMGLSAALGIVQAHDGAVVVESELGKGTTFRVYLPVNVRA